MDLEHFFNKIFIYISGFNWDWSTRSEAKIRTIDPNLLRSFLKKLQGTVMNEIAEYLHRI